MARDCPQNIWHSTAQFGDFNMGKSKVNHPPELILHKLLLLSYHMYVAEYRDYLYHFGGDRFLERFRTPSSVRYLKLKAHSHEGKATHPFPHFLIFSSVFERIAMSGYSPVQLITNSFNIVSLPNKEYFQYDVSFVPELKIANKRTLLFHRLQTTIAPNIFNPRAIYDGSAIAYCPAQLQLADNGSGTFFVDEHDSTADQAPHGDGKSRQPRQSIKITRTIGSVIRPSVDLQGAMKAGPVTERSRIATNLLQLIVRQGPNRHFTNNGRAYFPDEEKQPLGEGLEIRRGLFQSVRPSIDKMILTIDIATAVVYAGGSLLNLCMQNLKISDVARLDLRPSDPRYRELEGFLNRLRIKMQTGGPRPKTRTIYGLEPQAGRYVFMKDDNKETTVAEHFKEAYGITINPRIIGVRLSSDKAPKPIIVPLEVCTVVSGQLFKRKTPDHLTAQVIKFAAVRPQERFAKIRQGISRYRDSEEVKESGMRVDTTPIQVRGKLLTVPNLTYAPNASPVSPSRGAWNVLGQKFNNSASLTSWIVVNFAGERLPVHECERFMSNLQKCCETLGMETSRPYDIQIGNGHAVENSLETAAKLAGRIYMKPGAQRPPMNRHLIIVVILPQSAAHIRARVKHWGDVANGFMTQCLRIDKMSKGGNQYFNNVALKLNARLGGRNSHVNTSRAMSDLAKAPFMIIGADVSHPSPGIMRPSFTGFTFSYDLYGTQYAGITNCQEPRVEIIENLKANMTTALRNFALVYKGKFWPHRIFVFRDGVSDGEFKKVADIEIKAIEEAILEFMGAEKAATMKLSFIVVGKRHKNVFCPAPRREGERVDNCQPGSVIDMNIINPAVKDFYLLSHAAIQGTSRSSHYIVLKDDNYNFDVGRMQELAYALCHVYAKATRSVSIPAPVYYADLVCGRGMNHISPDSNLEVFEPPRKGDGKEKPKFDLAPWLEAFKKPNGGIEDRMYFL